MQNVVLTPRVFFAACLLAVGVVAQASPDASTDAATGAGDSGSPDGTTDGTVAGDGATGTTEASAATADASESDAAEDAGTVTVPPFVGIDADPSAWVGPPADDGSLDDGYAGNALTADNGNVIDYLGLGSCSTPPVQIPTPYSYNGVAKPYTDAAGCMAYDSQGHPNAHNCYCTSCFSLVQQCDALPGCKQIAKCFEDSGCANDTSLCTLLDAVDPKLGCSPTITCYLAPNAKCTTAVDTWGNGSVSTGVWGLLENCAQAAKCPNQ